MRTQATRTTELQRRRDNRLALLLAPAMAGAYAAILTWPVWGA